MSTSARIGDFTTRARRTAIGPILIRLVAAVAGLAAVLAAAPPDLPVAIALRLAGIGGLAAAAVGVFPRSRWVGLFLIGVVFEWLGTTIVFAEPAGLPRVGVLAAALYLVHSAAALGAVLPYDCVVPASVYLHWAGRVTTVLVVGVVVGVGGMAVAAFLPSARSVVGPIVGSVIAAGLAGLLAWHVRRRA
jgi:hypothetical protein